MTESAKVLLKVQDVHLAFDALKVLEGVNFDVIDRVRPDAVTGQIVGLLGPSGVGKTCLLRIIAGLAQADVGAVLDKDDKPIEAGTVGAVFQHYPLLRHRTVRSNLTMAGVANGMSRDEARKKADGLLESFGIAGRARAYPSQLSGGQRQRAALAQQLVQPKPILILDEPFSGLDPQALTEVIALLKEVAHRDEYNTILIITHDISAALLISDTLFMLGRDRDENGKIVSGAKIQHTYDLVELGVAWEDDIEHTPKFLELEREVKAQFLHL